VLAVGHYRNGVLLMPITADLVSGLLAQDLSKHEQMLANAFSPGNDDLIQGSQ
jgi:glycine/D-amino acid oxidase-like deaminating enzyme